MSANYNVLQPDLYILQECIYSASFRLYDAGFINSASFRLYDAGFIHSESFRLYYAIY